MASTSSFSSSSSSLLLVGILLFSLVTYVRVSSLSIVQNTVPTTSTTTLSLLYPTTTLLKAEATASTGTDITTTASSTNDNLILYYSTLFQRHVVAVQRKEHEVDDDDGSGGGVNLVTVVKKSFQFLDDARHAYPNATMIPLNKNNNSNNDESDAVVIVAISGGGLEESTAYGQLELQNNNGTVVDGTIIDSMINVMMLNDDNLATYVRNRLPPSRWTGLSPNRIRSNYQQLDRLLETKLQLKASAMAVVNVFPHVLLYHPKCVEDRLDFLLAPLPPPLLNNNTNAVAEETDWPLVASQGYGAGWTMEQVRMALQSVPHAVLAMHFEDVLAMRPSLLYFLTILHVSYKDVDEVPLQLDQWGDTYTFAYLYGAVGLSWLQLSIVLHAFPSLAICDTEPTWELIGKARRVLREDVLHYLQRRLQVGPRTVEAMLMTHSPLCSYSVEGRIKPTLDALQSKIGLSSRELRRIIVRMPSLMGMSVAESSDRGLAQRLKFFCCEVGMTQAELRTAVLKQPSLLQYSVENSLRPKLEFFVKELSIPMTDMPRLIYRSPFLMGRSLQETLRPTLDVFTEQCGLSPKEVGSVVSRVPEILGLSLKSNIEPKLDYLRNRLGLSRPQLKNLLVSTPRVLMHSVTSSLEPKFQLIQTALGNDDRSAVEAGRVLSQNPSLLVSNIASLQRRIMTGLTNCNNTAPTSVKKVLRRRSKGLKRRKKPVLEVDPVVDKVVREYSCASAAARELRTSLSNVYGICRTGRVWRGKKLVYGQATSVPEMDKVSLSVHYTLATQETANRTESAIVFSDLRSALMASNSPGQPPFKTNATLRMVVFVSGRVYPPDVSTKVRGTRRGGGMVLYFPQFDQTGMELEDRLRLAATKSFEQIMPAADNGKGTSYKDGRILVGFPYLRRSRNRCELYACHNAIKVVGQLLKQEAHVVSLKNETVQVDVYTDSDYAWKLLHNGTRLHTWGAVVDEKEFAYDGHSPPFLANPDLLHPLCRTYFRLVEQHDLDGTPLELGRQVHVTFRHAAGSTVSLHAYAKQAAMWMDERSKTPFQGDTAS